MLAKGRSHFKRNRAAEEEGPVNLNLKVSLITMMQYENFHHEVKYNAKFLNL